MKWSYRIATVAGIQVRIHLTFLLLLGFYAWIYYNEGGAEAAIHGVAFTLLIFFCVLLHEFGHAFAAKAFGIRTPDITLLPIGGVARLERMPANPWQELVIAIAGPAVNVFIVLGIRLIKGDTISGHELFLNDEASGSFLANLHNINLVLLLFNLIPAFPMDGGRVLRALLATRMRYAAATQVAARLGQVLAVIFAIVSVTLWGGPVLTFIAAFVFLGAQQELAYARFREAAMTLRVSQAMITRFHVLPVTLKVAEIPQSLSESSQEIFPFVDERFSFHGIATRDELQKALQDLPSNAAASCVARRLPTVNPETRFEDALDLMQRSSVSVLPVVNASDQIVGLVSLGNLARSPASMSPGRA
ncbi:MAG TPA: site-2 protease family protein [Terrimicrobiaceae bacterium]